MQYLNVSRQDKCVYATQNGDTAFMLSFLPPVFPPPPQKKKKKRFLFPKYRKMSKTEIHQLCINIDSDNMLICNKKQGLGFSNLRVTGLYNYTHCLDCVCMRSLTPLILLNGTYVYFVYTIQIN